MLIKFKKPDPRAGMTVRMDSSRGQHFVDLGVATRLKESGDEESAPSAPEDFDAAAFVDANAPEVVDALASVTDTAHMQAALEAEKAGKDRKSVVEAIEAAIEKAGEG